MATDARLSLGASISSEKSFKGLSGGSTSSSLRMIVIPERPTAPVDIVAGILTARESQMSRAAVRKARARLSEIAASCKTPAKRRRR